MPVYTVKPFDGPMPTGDEPILIEAPNAWVAAESVCGAPLADVGTPWSLRARVWEQSSPETTRQFYVKAG